MSKRIVILSVALLLFACTTKPQETQQSIADSMIIQKPETATTVATSDSSQLYTEEEPVDSLADSVGLDLHGAQTAILFLNEYVRPTPGSRGWLYSPLLTDNFKKAYSDFVSKYSNDEGGLDFDPILVAQDEPSAFSVKTFSKSGYVTAQGVNWPSFIVTVRLIRRDTVWLVEGSGVINIPKAKQVAR